MAEDTRCCRCTVTTSNISAHSTTYYHQCHGTVSPTVVLYHVNRYFFGQRAPLAFQCCAPQARLLCELHEAWLLLNDDNEDNNTEAASPTRAGSPVTTVHTTNPSAPSSPSNHMDSEASHWTHHTAISTSNISSSSASMTPASPLHRYHSPLITNTTTTTTLGNAEDRLGVVLRLSAQRHGPERDAIVTNLTSLELMRWWLLRSGIAGVVNAPYPLRSIEFRLSERMSDAALEAQAEMFFLLCSSTLRRLVFNGRGDVHTHLRGLSCIALLQRLTELNLRHTIVDYRGNTHTNETDSKDNVRSSWATDAALRRVLRHLEYLVVGDYYLPRQLPLAELHSLRVIDLSGTGLDDTALASLAKCDKLERVILSGCVAVTNWMPLTALTRMRVLDLQGTRINDATLTSLCHACCDLVEVNLSGCLFVRNCPALGQLTQLTTLHLARTSCTPVTIRSLAALPTLHTLSLRSVARDDLFTSLSFAASLREIDCHGYALTEDGLKTLCHSCPQLRRCVLSGVRYVEDFTSLAMLRELRWLNVSGTGFDDRALALVSEACGKLMTLVCFGCQGIKSFAPVAQLTQLRVLNASDTTIDDASLAAIASHCSALEELSLHFCRYVRDLAPLRQCKRLKRLGLGGMSLSESNGLVTQRLAQRGVSVSTQLQLLHMVT